MIVGVPKETVADERRVALVPELVPKLKQAGLDVWVETGAAAFGPEDPLLHATSSAPASTSVLPHTHPVLAISRRIPRHTEQGRPEFTASRTSPSSR